MKNIMLIIGTRPEAIKMCPLAYALRKRPDFHVTICATGQHEEMLEQVFQAFNLTPDHNLHIMKANQNLFDITMQILNDIRKLYEAEKPALVLVHGDTTTAFSAALAAFYMKIPVGHVEAGLRTYRIFAPYPEEFNRQSIDSMTSYFFAPTENAKSNLLAEKKDDSAIYVTGNTAIDALQYTVDPVYQHPLLTWSNGSRLMLITIHRRENLGEPMRQIFTAIRKVLDEYDDVRAVYPVHLNPTVQSIARSVFDGCEKIRLVPPMDVIDFHNIMAKSYLILTDSGGVQEEAPSLKVPVLVARNTTERQEGVDAGITKVIGTETNTVYMECRKLLDQPECYRSMIAEVNPYGDGKASERIADIICGLMETT